MTRIFISYIRADTDADSNALYQSLASEFGAGKIYKDVHNIPLGAAWRDEVVSAVEDSAVMLVLIGPQWVATDAISFELTAAIERDIPVIPLLVRNADLAKLTAGLDDPLRRVAETNGASLRHDAWERDLAPVIKTIQDNYLPVADGTTPGGDVSIADELLRSERADRRVTIWSVLAAALLCLAVGVVGGRYLPLFVAIALGVLVNLLVQLRYGLNLGPVRSWLRSWTKAIPIDGMKSKFTSWESNVPSTYALGGYRVGISVLFVVLSIAGTAFGLLGITESSGDEDSPASPRQGQSDNSTTTSGSGVEAEDGLVIGQFCAEAQAGSRSLSRADLTGCDLEDVDLSGIDLSSTGFSGASLRNANLAGSVLNRTDLRDADLTGATMTGAHLYRVEFEGAEGLDEIDWSGVLVERSVCGRGIQCEFVGAVTINSSLVTCIPADFARGAPIASKALDKPLLWQDDDEDCLHDEYERAGGILLGNDDTDGDGLVDGIDGHGGDETPLSLFEQFRTIG